jgi:hypothetical protein
MRRIERAKMNDLLDEVRADERKNAANELRRYLRRGGRSMAAVDLCGIVRWGAVEYGKRSKRGV